ncbi:unnamed protein product [Cyprideis torosa]|uniref:Uncharacterized protein n=1 Tax=Cyprideis torosa TaxID=163714 RepID=A0A7R8W0P2_9CRUS|nr:unnamed protein product [Cyprideis torosa]CAG0879952.1 unnamed protein product [Cyprideis torosa]
MTVFVFNLAVLLVVFVTAFTLPVFEGSVGYLQSSLPSPVSRNALLLLPEVSATTQESRDLELEYLQMLNKAVDMEALGDKYGSGTIYEFSTLNTFSRIDFERNSEQGGVDLLLRNFEPTVHSSYYIDTGDGVSPITPVMGDPESANQIPGDYSPGKADDRTEQNNDLRSKLQKLMVDESLNHHRMDQILETPASIHHSPRPNTLGTPPQGASQLRPLCLDYFDVLETSYRLYGESLELHLCNNPGAGLLYLLSPEFWQIPLVPVPPEPVAVNDLARFQYQLHLLTSTGQDQTDGLEPSLSTTRSLLFYPDGTLGYLIYCSSCVNTLSFSFVGSLRERNCGNFNAVLVNYTSLSTKARMEAGLLYLLSPEFWQIPLVPVPPEPVAVNDLARFQYQLHLLTSTGQDQTDGLECPLRERNLNAMVSRELLATPDPPKVARQCCPGQLHPPLHESEDGSGPLSGRCRSPVQETLCVDLQSHPRLHELKGLFMRPGVPLLLWLMSGPVQSTWTTPVSWKLTLQMNR